MHAMGHVMRRLLALTAWSDRSGACWGQAGGVLVCSSPSLICLWEQDGSDGAGGLATVACGVDLIWCGCVGRSLLWPTIGDD